MNSTSSLDKSSLAAVNPNEALSARADERLAHAYEQIVRADEQLAQVTAQLSKLGHDAARHPAAVPGGARGRPVLRGLIGLVLAGCIGAAAYASQSPSGEATRLTMARWAPFLLPASSPWLAKPGNAAQPSPPTVQPASADATILQPAQSSQGPAKDAASTPAPTPAALAALLQTMARDLATVEQAIEQLKASQDQMATDSARAIEQIKAGQDQMMRLAARPPVQDQRAKTPVPAAPPVASAAHKPPPPQPSQARARLRPVQLVPDDQ